MIILCAGGRLCWRHEALRSTVAHARAASFQGMRSVPRAWQCAQGAVGKRQELAISNVAGPSAFYLTASPRPRRRGLTTTEACSLFGFVSKVSSILVSERVPRLLCFFLIRETERPAFEGITRARSPPGLKRGHSLNADVRLQP